jgi:predicted nucleic acid-binding protein
VIYLVDTNVLSDGAPARAIADPALIAWLVAHSDKLTLSVVKLMEIQAGIAKARRQGAERRADALETWLDTIIADYEDRVWPVDTHIALLAGYLRDRALGLGHDPGTNDTLIAATAAHHRLTVLTRNLRHFQPLGVKAIDPAAGLPA